MGARTGLLAGLLAVVAALAVWLSDCVPGFGIGDGGGEGEVTEKTSPPAAEKTDSKPAEPGLGTAEPVTARIEVGIAGCALGEELAIPCADLCKRIAADELASVTKVIVAAKQGSHADVTTLLDCLKAKKLLVAMQRD